MITIPSRPKGYGPWEFKCKGQASKFTKNIIEEIIKIVLINHKIKKKEVKIEIYLQSPDQMAESHKKFLNKEGPTDTISIPIDNKSLNEERPTLLGTMILCPKIIKEDAEYLKKNEQQHLAHIVVHSTLHLLGYCHETEEEKKQMEAKEVIILTKLGVPSPYLTR